MKTKIARQARAANMITRRQIQAATVDACRPLVSQIVDELALPSERREAAEQLGAIGILVALESYPESAKADARFRFFARSFVRAEIQRWLTHEPDGDGPDGPEGDDGEPIPVDDAVCTRRAA